jgi:hypothetical protein
MSNLGKKLVNAIEDAKKNGLITLLKRDTEKALDRLDLNKITLKVFEETDKNKNVIKAKNVKEIFEKAGI